MAAAVGKGGQFDLFETREGAMRRTRIPEAMKHALLLDFLLPHLNFKLPSLLNLLLALADEYKGGLAHPPLPQSLQLKKLALRSFPNRLDIRDMDKDGRDRWIEERVGLLHSLDGREEAEGRQGEVIALDRLGFLGFLARRFVLRRSKDERRPRAVEGSLAHHGVEVVEAEERVADVPC